MPRTDQGFTEYMANLLAEKREHEKQLDEAIFLDQQDEDMYEMVDREDRRKAKIKEQEEIFDSKVIPPLVGKDGSYF